MSDGTEEDGEMRDRSSKPVPAAPVGERRYTEEELALILNRAAERQEGVQASAARYSLADIQEIAAGAGIAPDHVAHVAAALRDGRAPRAGGVLGAPFSFRFEESIDGEVADDVVGDLFDVARNALMLQGEVIEALGTVEWKAQDAFGWTYVTVARRGGRTTIGIFSVHTDAAAVAGTVGGLGAVFGSLGIGAALIGVAGLAPPLAVLAGIGLATSGAWASTRAAWRRAARRFVTRTETVGATLVATARNAVQDGRVRGT